jgi:hypothetical protein
MLQSRAFCCFFALLTFGVPVRGQRLSNFDLMVYGNVRFFATDSLGRRTGIDPRIPDTLSQIPFAGQGFTDNGDLDAASLEEALDSGTIAYNFSLIHDVDSATTIPFVLTVVGLGPCTYTVYYATQTLDSVGGVSLEESGVLDSGEAVAYNLRYSSASGGPSVFSKIVDSAVFRQDLTNCLLLGWIASPTLATALQSLASGYRSNFASGDIGSAILDLTEFRDELYTAVSDPTKMDANAFAILNEDDSLLIAQLPARYTVVAVACPGGLIVDASSPDFTPPVLSFAGTATVDTFVVQAGQNMPLYIDTVAGYYIDSLYVDGNSIAPQDTFTFVNVTAPHTITAVFGIYAYPITASAFNGTITPSGATYVDYGSNQGYAFAPNPGYQLDTLYVDGVPNYDSASSFTFYNVTSWHTITAVYRIAN